MKILLHPATSRRRDGGWALLVVLTLTACAAMIMAGVLNWSNTSSWVIARNNEYYATTYAAEAATEKALARIISDYENFGQGLVYSQLSAYATNLPSAADDPYWTNYVFSAGAGQTNSISITMINPTNVVVLGPPYQGLIMDAWTYEIIATAANNSSAGFAIPAAVGQQVNLGVVPIFQFAIFYQNTLEIDPGADMHINGMVHGNNNIYIDPPGTLTFSNGVSSSGTMTMGENPLDPSSRTPPTGVVFATSPLSGVNPLILPVGTNSSGAVSNMSQNVQAILQIPPPGVSPTSTTGSNYLYNQADVIILISNNGVTVTSGVIVDNRATIISNAAWSLWLITNSSAQFYDQRDQLTNQSVDIDVGKLKAWSNTNTTLRPVLQSLRGTGAADVQSIFVADLRSTSNAIVTSSITTNTTITTNTVATNTSPSTTYPGANTYVPPVTTNTTLTTNSSAPAAGTYIPPYNQSSGKYIYQKITGYSYAKITSILTNNTYLTNYSTNWNVNLQPGIVLTNGSTMPGPFGLSIVTPDPAYIVGNYNVSTNGVNLYTGTSDTSHTYPAAIYADAISVLSSAWNPANSSAGIGSRTATSDTVNAAFLTGIVPSDGNTYSGGVENFPRLLENWSGQTLYYNGSMVAMFNSVVATAPWPGTGSVYNPPTRTWAFDLNFNNAAKLPPLTPHVISVNRAKWVFLNANTTSF